MSKPRLAGFPAALFLTGLGLSMYFGNQWRILPTYSEEEIAQSVELNLAIDLQRQGQQASVDDPKLVSLRAKLDSEVRDEIAREQKEIFKGLAAGSVALLISLMQMIWLRRAA